ncbi:MAG: hypothetical protein IJ689_03295 [Alphaproteobacteria bacterium]|nr:hypothetical protein [Alphaproteobacteria bacterium]
MKNYILLLGVAAVSIGSYCAYAGNSATMTVTAAIAHDISLIKTRDINMGTITINPAVTAGPTRWFYSDTGEYSLSTGEAIISADNATVGTFTANISNPSYCDGESFSCGGLVVTGNYDNEIYSFFGEYSEGYAGSNSCGFKIKYSGSENIFKVYPSFCYIGASGLSYVTAGSHSGTLTISYNPG